MSACNKIRAKLALYDLYPIGHTLIFKDIHQEILHLSICTWKHCPLGHTLKAFIWPYIISFSIYSGFNSIHGLP